MKKRGALPKAASSLGKAAARDVAPAKGKRPVANTDRTIPKRVATAAPTASRKAAPTENASMLHVRVADRLKQEATKVLEQIGLTPSEAVRLFLHRIVVDQRLPLDLCVPNAQTQAAILEARALSAKPRRFKAADDMFKSLEKTS
ncbi:type II toxin-antitoxin system RelB/DinJ family antitoxin [Beijerinckia sp. L45]|uniref:type II toxin-antitoxin system RelB/DinJ family antitoxin n=1 Tax=Beijerinckia sp. L45 TaxID=1641855 RepID=UPI001AEE91EB|nr:type II toxin-antitoxin system RelB/DinJ family antitoxin [Beijerinckia sp. L45]